METAEIRSFIRGFHVYRDVWTPVSGGELVLECETINLVTADFVAVIKDTAMMVGHVPANLAPIVCSFLSRANHSGTVVVTGGQVRGAGFGRDTMCLSLAWRTKILVYNLKRQSLL